VFIIDRITKTQNADVLTQFADMKFNEGIIAERKRITKKLVNNGYCCYSKELECIISYDKCIKCWEEYFNEQ